MGALASNRKRGEECLSFNHNPYQHSPNIHVSKKPRFSFALRTPDEPVLVSNSTVSRISRYPEAKTPFRRAIHAPCRVLRFGLSALATKEPRVRLDWHHRKEQELGHEMENILRRNYENAKRSALSSLRFLRKDKEEPQKEAKSEDSNIEVVEVIEDGRDGTTVESEGKMVAERNLLPSSSSVTTDLNNANCQVGAMGNMLDSLSLNAEVLDLSSVEAYRKLLESAERRTSKLQELGFEIALKEKRRAQLRKLRPVKQPSEKHEEVPREPFLPLSKEETAEVQRVLTSNNGKVLVTHTKSNIDITGQILQCLRPAAWLNDEVINVYLELLKEREIREPHKFLKCHFFNTFFYKKLVSGGSGYNYRAVKRWTTERKLGYSLLDCDKIFVPIHKEIHWCLAVINKKDQKFQYLDSLKGMDTRVLTALAKYYMEEVKDKSGKDIDVSSWEREFVDDLPEQENGYDCGMFMLKYIDFYSRGLRLFFSQEHMPYFRMRTAKEILRLRAD